MKLTIEKKVKLDCMLTAITFDYFGYGSTIKKRKNHYYEAHIDGEKFIFTAHDLINDFDSITNDEREEVMSIQYLKYIELSNFNKNNIYDNIELFKKSIINNFKKLKCLVKLMKVSIR